MTKAGVILFAFVLLVMPMLSFSAAYAQTETIFATRPGTVGSYALSSETVISPELYRPYFAEPAWVASEKPVTVRVLDGGNFYVRVFGPGGTTDTGWLLVTGSFTFLPTTNGNWFVDLGRTGEFFRVIFTSVSTIPPQNLVAYLKVDVERVAGWGLTASQADELLTNLDVVQKQLERNNRLAATNALDSFIKHVEDDIAAGPLPWAKGQAWINAANFVKQQISN